MESKQIMKKPILFATLIFALFPTPSICQNSSEQKIQTVAELVKKYVDKNNVPAISVVLLIDDELHFINTGLHNRKEPQKVNENSIFQIASLSKLFTGAIINDLIQNGKIDVNETIVRYLPDNYPPKIRKKLKGITVRDLLHHRSGLPRQSMVINRKHEDEPIVYDYKEIDFINDFKKMKLKFKSGKKFSYSNFGYSVLGYLAENVTDKSFEELLSDLVERYGMEHTSINCENKTMLVTPYNEDNRNLETIAWELGKLTPPTGVYSTTYDLSKLLGAQLEAYKDMNKENTLFLTNDTRTAWKDTGIYYGYGMFDWGNGGFGHGGGMDGYGSEYWLNPKSNVGFVILTSSGGQWLIELSKEVNKILED